MALEIKFNIWQLFILISVIFFSTNIQAEEKKFLFPKVKYEWVKGKGVEVCELYLQNLLKFRFMPSRYPHKIHPDFAEQLIHPPPNNWRLLDQHEYEQLYLRFHSSFFIGYPEYYDSPKQISSWKERFLYTLDLDINNDGENEAMLGDSYTKKILEGAPVFLVANLAEQSINETLSKHLLRPRLLLTSESTDYYPIRMVSETEKNELIARLKKKNYSEGQILSILKKWFYSKLATTQFSAIRAPIQDDFFVYNNKTYVTRVFVSLQAPPKRDQLHIYKTENKKTEEICIYKHYFD